MAKENPQLREHWNRVKEEHKAAEGRGVVEAICRGGRIQIVAPFRAGFPTDAREIRGKWRARSRCWSFPAKTTSEKTALSDLLLKYHGDRAMVPDLFSLPSLRNGRRAEGPRREWRDTCETGSHLWIAGFSPGDTCQCGELYLLRHGGGWEVKERTE